MPPLAASNRPGRSWVGAGERAARVAEQLALEQGLGDGAAVDGDERPGGARRLVVDQRARSAPCRRRSRR